MRVAGSAEHDVKSPEVMYNSEVRCEKTRLAYFFNNSRRVGLICHLKQIRQSNRVVDRLEVTDWGTEMADSDQDELNATGSITMLYQQLRAGRGDALNDLIHRFWPRLMALANSTLAGRLQRVADAEDALQSAIISFWEQVGQGDFKLEMDRNDLWNVLGLITVRKALKLQEKERAQKRGGGRVVTGMPLEGAAAPVSEAEFDLLCTELLELLEPDLRAFALLRLLGHKNREIAVELNCTERKVERKLNLIRSIWGAEASLW